MAVNKATVRASNGPDQGEPMGWNEEQFEEARAKAKQLEKDYLAEGIPQREAAEAALSVVTMEFGTRRKLQDAALARVNHEDYMGLNMDERLKALYKSIDDAAEAYLADLIAPAEAAVGNAQCHVKNEFRKRLEEILLRDAETLEEKRARNMAENDRLDEQLEGLLKNAKPYGSE